MWLAIGTQTRELREGDVVVGSGADADWRVPTADLMPRHFELKIHGLNASLKPVSKDIVVAVNGKQITNAPYLLNDGDVVCAGSGRFLFSDESPRISTSESSPVETSYLVDDQGRVSHRLVSRSTTIGRDASNTVVVRDPAASRFHAEIRREAGGFALHSMGSGGTILNQKRLDAPTLLQDGDAIEIAYTRFRFARSVPADLAPAPLHTSQSDRAQRSPTLTTGKISVVAATGRSSAGKLFLGVIVLTILALAFAFGR